MAMYDSRMIESYNFNVFFSVLRQLHYSDTHTGNVIMWKNYCLVVAAFSSDDFLASRLNIA